MVPDELRGRVMSVYSMMFMGMAPLGAPYTVALGGAVCIFGSIIFALRLPYLREEGRQMIVAMQMTAGVPASKASFQTPTLTAEHNAFPKS